MSELVDIWTSAQFLLFWKNKFDLLLVCLDSTVLYQKRTAELVLGFWSLQILYETYGEGVEQ